MSNKPEDLYVKGFMAFSKKDYASAKNLWEQVLSIDPNHEKARKGLADLQTRAGKGKKKRSSKEVFAEIKKLYAAKNYTKALSLCELLLEKHPTNKDLQGLKTKLEKRIAAKSEPGRDRPPAKSTMYMAGMAEASVGAEDKAGEVDKLIQEGVGLYEMQDFTAAIKVWKQAIQLDPANRIARDYIANVEAQLSDEPEPTPEPEPEPAPAEPTPPRAKPGKEEMARIYGEAMAFYKAGDYRDALDKWQQILAHYPTHKETRQCVQRTEAILAQEENRKQLEQAKAHLMSGNKVEAERIATELAINAPDLEGLAALRNELAASAGAEAEEISSLDLDEGASSTPAPAPVEVIRPDREVAEHHESHTASEDQLEAFFEPDRKASGKMRQVSKVVKARREKKPLPLKTLIGVPLVLIILGIGGYFGYQYYSKQLRTDPIDTANITLREVHWNSAQQQSSDFLEFGRDFADAGDPLLASIAFQRVIEIARPRLAALGSRDQTNPDVIDESAVLSETLAEAEQENARVVAMIEPDETNEKDMERAQAELGREQYTSASERLHNMLSADRDNIHLRDMLGSAYQSLAFRNLKKRVEEDGEMVIEGDWAESFELFKKATVLLSGNDMARHHTEVINRFFSGKITSDQTAQWFFFFID